MEQLKLLIVGAILGGGIVYLIQDTDCPINNSTFAPNNPVKPMEKL